MRENVLLYSGGLDSYIAAFLLKPDLCLYIHTGACYSDKELTHMTRPPHNIELSVDRETCDLSVWERSDLIVPQRNAYLVLIAAMYGNTILLASTKGDRSTDKDMGFVVHMNALFAHLWKPQHWLPKGRHPHVDLPVKSYTKGRLVEQYLKEGGDPAVLSKLVSCYHPDVVQCGWCKACARKWVALTAHDVPASFERDPALYYCRYNRLGRAVKGEYRGEEEDAELIKAWTVSGHGGLPS